MSVSYQEISEGQAGQRIDNYLVTQLKGVPRSRIYKAVRGGEVRVNGSRVRVSHRLETGDVVRIPPIRTAQRDRVAIPPKLLEQIPILYEDNHLLVVNKPSGLPVHGGSGVDYGLIEAFRELSPDIGRLELVHRLDRETSGCLLMARDRPTLLGLQEQLGSERSIKKIYRALVAGHPKRRRQEIRLKLSRREKGGDRGKMQIDKNGQFAHSVMTVVEELENSTLVDMRLHTGRTHQARVHCAGIGHPIAGDRVYGDFAFNRVLQGYGLGRLFLHAAVLEFEHPVDAAAIEIRAPLPDGLESVLESLGSNPVARQQES